jgi:hypothetical protein
MYDITSYMVVTSSGPVGTTRDANVSIVEDILPVEERPDEVTMEVDLLVDSSSVEVLRVVEERSDEVTAIKEVINTSI